MRLTRRCLVASTAVFPIAVLFSAFGCVPSASTRAAADRDMRSRLQQAFELEKQSRRNVTQPGYAPANPGLDSIGGLRATLASERGNRVQIESELARLRAQDAEHRRSGAEVASLRAELAGEQNRNENLRQELQRWRDRAVENPSPGEVDTLRAQLDEEVRRRQAAEEELARLSSGGQSSVAPSDEVIRLRAALHEEQTRRLDVERAWARLREETSVPAFGSDDIPEIEVLAIKQELIETRSALATERKAREIADDQLRSVQGAGMALPNIVDENRQLRERVHGLQMERDGLREQLGLEENAEASSPAPASQRSPRRD